MVISFLKNYSRYQHLHPLFERAFHFLLQTDLALVPEGKTEIEGDDLFAIVSYPGSSSPDNVKLEAHKKYIDIHFIIEGFETFGWKEITECKNPEGVFNDEKDYIFYNDSVLQTMELYKNNIVIVYPEDAHAPCIHTRELRKIVIKIKL